MADPVVHITNGLPDLGTGNITTLGQTIPPAGTTTSSVQGGPMVQGAVTTGAPSYTNGQTNPLSLTTTGGLRVDGSAVTQPVSLSGTVTVSGTVTATQGSPPWTVKPDGTAWAMTSTSANVNVTNTVPVSGTFFQATQPISAVSLPLPTGAATAANQITAVGIGSTTTGQTGGLSFGATTTAAPTYTNGQSNPLSLTIAGAMRVDGSGVTQPVSGSVSVSSGTVTVSSGIVTANQGGTWTVQPGNTANTTAWLVTGTGGTFPVTAASLPLPTGAATSGNQPSSATQGSTTSGQTGTLAMGAVTTASPTYTTAQTSPLSLDTTGALRVNVTAGGASGGTSSTFGVAFPATGTAIGVKDSAGTNMTFLQVNASNALKVDGSAVTQPVSGTVTANQGGSWTVQPGNTANTTAWLVTGTGGTFPATQSGNWTSRIVGNAGATLDTPSSQNQAMPTNMLMVGGEFNTTPTTITSGNASPLQMNAAGSLRVDGSGVTQPVSGTVAISGTVAATQSGTWTVQQGTPPWTVNGDTASGATDANNPVKIGGLAKTTNPTAVTDGQRVAALFDKQGKQVVVGAVRQLKGVQKTSISSASETTVVTAGAAGVFNDVYAIVVTNKSATAVFVDFKDATAGTTRMTLAAPASDTRGFTVAVDSAMVQATAANNWTATVSSAVTSIEITMLYVSNL